MKGEPLEIISQVPIACSLDPLAKTERVLQWRQLIASALTHRERIPGGIRLHFEPGAEEAARELANLEKQCCSFFEFRFESGSGDFLLEVSAPAEGRPVLDALFESAGTDSAD